MASEPRRPQPNSEQVQAVREQGTRTIEDDVPKGTVWKPAPEDFVSHRQKAALEIPSFIPLRLDQPGNASQASLARNVLAEQGVQQESNQMQHQAPPDFDPAVDDPEDVFVGEAGLHTEPSVFKDSHGNKIDPRQQKQKLQLTKAPMEHPVLQRLRERFGLKALETKSETIGGMKFTFRKYTNQAYAKFVINYVQSPMSVETDAEFMTKLPYALAAISIAAIDGVPVHEVFASSLDLDPVLELQPAASDPLHPPTSVTVKVAEVLYPWLVSLSVPELGDTLAATLGRLFPEERLIKDKGLWKYVCPKRGCTESHERLPRYDVEGKMKPVYCTLHGVPMKALGSLEELADVPLA